MSSLDDDWKQVTDHKEKPLMDLFIKKPGDIFIDVGAHAGRWVLPMAPVFRWIIAFEPNPDAYDKLIDNILSAKIMKAEAHQLAVSDRKGVGELCELDGVPSRSTLYPKYSGLKVTHQWSVSFVTLDDWLEWLEPYRQRFLGRDMEPGSNLVKVDVEGAELDVLRGSKRILKKWRPRLCVETHSEGLYKSCSRLLRSIDLPFETRTLEEEAPASTHAAKGEKHKYIIRT